jgi:3'-phosphoadenosine 5'-phosphosulfate sulfotransferase (PAPS reductase)/FAD synthetase
MKNYLSYGGGVNSTAMMLVLLDEGVEFEAVYVDHGCDRPETQEYIEYISGRYPLTVVRPNVQGFHNLYEYFWRYRTLPFVTFYRLCTDKFKVRVLHKHYERPCFELIGISSEESHRARVKHNDGIETRYPLIERDIDRKECIRIIKAHGLRVPIRSGCWFCPFQKRTEWRSLRREHPELFCKAVQLEKRSMAYRRSVGKKPMTLLPKGPDLLSLVQENQLPLFPERAYPPCSCGL